MPNPMWTADIDVDAALAARLVAAQFPAFAGARIEAFGAGWDNAAFLAGGSVVFRFPRRRVVAELIVREVAVLPHAAPYLPLAITVPRFVGEPTADFPWTFAGYDLIGGVTACSVALSHAERAALAEPLAGFLRALHALDPAPFVARGLPPDEIGRLDHAKRLDLATERLAGLDGLDVAGEAQAGLAWMRAHPPSPLPEDERRLVHGDLYARHVLIDVHARPTGVIDWGDVHHGDPALDIAVAHLMLPPSAHAVFREAYGAIDERTWSAARYRAIYHAMLELDYGVRSGDAAMRDIGAAALRLLAASPA